MNKIIRTIHAEASETVEIHWHKARADVHVLIERHTAPPDETWKIRTASESLSGSPERHAGTVPDVNERGGSD